MIFFRSKSTPPPKPDPDLREDGCRARICLCAQPVVVRGRVLEWPLPEEMLLLPPGCKRQSHI